MATLNESEARELARLREFEQNIREAASRNRSEEFEGEVLWALEELDRKKGEAAR